MGHHLFWYGTGQIVGRDLVLDVRLPPSGFRQGDEWILTARLDGAPVVEGSMVVMTISDDTHIWVASIAHDPDPTNGGAWRGDLKGTWPVRVGKRVRPSRFERKEVV